MSHSKPLPRPSTLSPKPGTAASPAGALAPRAGLTPPKAAAPAPRVASPVLKTGDIGVLQARPGEQVHLLAGQMYFGSAAARVHTLLGSCVAVTLWNPVKRIGGMCHFLLPNRNRPAGAPRDARFGTESLEMLVEALQRAGTKPSDYTVHLYGGADTMPDTGGIKFNVGERNIEQGWTLIDQYGFNLENVDVGDHVPRNVSMTFPDGKVEMRRGKSMKMR